jgi:zinc/manganese transport system substrate-binding protein
MRGRYRNTLALTAALGLVAAACGGDDAGTTAAPTTVVAPPTTEGAPAATDPPEPESEEAVQVEDLPLIVATTTIWADVTNNVVCGNLAEVVSVVPAGTDSHQFEPSLQDRGLMGDADMVVTNGLFLEEGLVGTIEAVEAEGVAVFAIAEAMDDLIEFEDDHGHGEEKKDEHDHGHGHGHDEDKKDDHGHSHDGDDDHDEDHHGDDDHGHSHDGDDPHVWFDPVRVASVLPMLGEAIVEATGIDAQMVTECVAAYQAELLEMDAAMMASFDTIEESMRKLVSTHESLGYLADRYGFEIIGTVLTGTSSLAETNPAALEELAGAIIAAGVPAIFAEAESSSADIEALAGRIGNIAVVELKTESLGQPGSGSDTYLGFLAATAETITNALTS